MCKRKLETESCMINDNKKQKQDETFLSKFKPIPGFSKYLISEDGEIYSNWRKRLLKTDIESCVKTKSYVRIKIKDNNGTNRSMRLHRLVAMAFIPNPENKPTVNHKDGNIYNNSVSNLEWATMQEQAKHVIKTGLRKKYKIGNLPIIRILPNNTTQKFNSAADASRKLKISKKSVSNYLNRKYKPRDKSQWTYLSDYELRGNDTHEEWKTVVIDGKETEYFISSLGRFKYRNSLREGTIRCGYRTQSLTINNKGFLYRTHRLVAFAFLGPPEDPSMTVDHIDRNPLNNKLENLRWATPSEQCLNKSRSRTIIMYDKTSGIKLQQFNSIKEAVDYLNLNYKSCHSSISRVCNKKQKFAYGYVWSYAE